MVTGRCLIKYFNDTPTLFQICKPRRKFRLLRHFINIKSAILILTFYLSLISLWSLIYQLKIHLSINIFYLNNIHVTQLLKLLQKIFIQLITGTYLIFWYKFFFRRIFFPYFYTFFNRILWLYEKIHINLFSGNTFIQIHTHFLAILAWQNLKKLWLKLT
jgi:hypothetical protein